MTSNIQDDIQRLRQDMNKELLASLKREMKARDEIKRREAHEVELKEQIVAWKPKADEAARLCRPDFYYDTSLSFIIPPVSYPQLPLSHSNSPDNRPAIARHNELRNPRPESLLPRSFPHYPSPVGSSKTPTEHTSLAVKLLAIPEADQSSGSAERP